MATISMALFCLCMFYSNKRLLYTRWCPALRRMPMAFLAAINTYHTVLYKEKKIENKQGVAK